MMKTTHKLLLLKRSESDCALAGNRKNNSPKQSLRTFAFTLVLLALCTLQTFAQNVTVSGKVTDPADNSALPGVNITVKGTTNGTVTDGSGQYSISVPSNSTWYTALSAIHLRKSL
jgi:hypothetical protein